MNLVVIDKIKVLSSFDQSIVYFSYNSCLKVCSKSNKYLNTSLKWFRNFGLFVNITLKYINFSLWHRRKAGVLGGGRLTRPTGHRKPYKKSCLKYCTRMLRLKCSSLAGRPCNQIASMRHTHTHTLVTIPLGVTVCVSECDSVGKCVKHATLSCLELAASTACCPWQMVWF